MKKTLVSIIIATVALTTTPVQGAESIAITSVQNTETGSYINFTDGTGYYIEGYNTEADNLYLLSGIVTEVECNSDYDMVTMEDMNGNLFQWFTDCGDWKESDAVTCIIDSNGTENNIDDMTIGTL